VQRCNSPPVYNLISVGGQHQGASAWRSSQTCPHAVQVCLDFQSALASAATCAT
jgi:hypothetical protein